MAHVTLIAGQTRFVFGTVFRRGQPVEITDHLDYFAAAPEFAVSVEPAGDEAPTEPGENADESAGADAPTEPGENAANDSTTFTTADLPEPEAEQRPRKSK